MPNLRSIVAQVHQKSRSIGSHRNFSSRPPPEVKVAGRRIRLTGSFSLSFGIGICCYSFKEMYRYYKYLPTLDRHLEEEKLRLQRREG